MSGGDDHVLGDQERLREALLRAEQALVVERKLRSDAEAMLEGLRCLVSASSVEQVDPELLQALRGLFHFRYAAMLVDEGAGVLVARAATAPHLAGSRWSVGPMLRRVLDGQPVAIFEILEVHEWADQPASVRGAARSALHVPLITSRRAAVLVATHHARAFFSPRHIELARRFAEMAAPVLESLEMKASEHARRAAEERAGALEDRHRALVERNRELEKALSSLLQELTRERGT